MKKLVFPVILFGLLMVFSLAFQAPTMASQAGAAATKTLTPTPLPTWTPAAGAQTITLKVDGKGDYKDLPEAIKVAKENDVIFLEKGTYTLKNPLTISKGLTLLGSGMDQTIIASKSGDTGITYKGSGLLAVRDLTVRQDASDHTLFLINQGMFNLQAIRITKTKNDRYFALYITGSARGTVRNSVITKNCAGIGINDKASVSIEENEIYQNRGTGVYIEKDAKGTVTIRKNIIKNNYQGVGVNNDTVLIEDNDFLANDRGIGFHNNSQSKAVRNRLSTNLNSFVVFDDAVPSIEENLIFKNCWGMWMANNAGGTIQKNQWNNNMIAVVMEGEAKPKITENQFKENGVGLQYTADTGGTASKNTITDTKSTEKFSVPGWKCWMNTNYGSGIVASGKAAPTLEENVISGSSGNGILFKEESRGTARKNELSGNQVGIAVSGLADPKLEDNIMKDNKKADVEDIRVGAVVKPTPTLAPSPTPAPTVEPMSVVNETLADVKVEKKDTAKFLKSWSVYQSPNNAKEENGMVILAGVKNPYQGFIHPREFGENSGVMFQFKWVGKKEITIGYDRGDWGTDTYKSYDVDPLAGKFSPYVFKGTKSSYLGNLETKLSPKVDTLYNLLMVVGKDGVFLTRIWDPAEPKKLYTNYYNKPDKNWAGQTWTFRIRIENDTTSISIKDFFEVTFNEIKLK